VKIIHVANHVMECGNGIVNVLVDLACLQAKLGHEVVVVSGGGQYVALLEKYGVRHVTLAQRPVRPHRVPGLMAAFVGIVRRERPDVIHAHMFTGMVLAKLAKLAKLVKRFMLVATVHNEFASTVRLMAYADRVVGVSEAVTQAMHARGVPRERLRTVRNGTLRTVRNRTAAAEVAVQKLARPNIACVAGLYTRKGIDVLIRAFARVHTTHPEAHLYLLGEGPDRQAFEDLSRSLGLTESVHFLGFQANVRDHLRQADIFVLASHQEPFGLVLLEAREAGCAVIATNVDGIPEALSHGKAGILVPPGDSDAIAVEVARLLGNEAALISQREKASQGLDDFSVEGMVREYLHLYRGGDPAGQHSFI
jgi:glycosyltransferase involved in cell wall biosynthesis